VMRGREARDSRLAFQEQRRQEESAARPQTVDEQGNVTGPKTARQLRTERAQRRSEERRVRQYGRPFTADEQMMRMVGPQAWMEHQAGKPARDLAAAQTAALQAETAEMQRMGRMSDEQRHDQNILNNPGDYSPEQYDAAQQRMRARSRGIARPSSVPSQAPAGGPTMRELPPGEFREFQDRTGVDPTAAPADVLSGVVGSQHAFDDTDWATIHQSIRESKRSERGESPPWTTAGKKSQAIEDVLHDPDIDDATRYARAEAIRTWDQRLRARPDVSFFGPDAPEWLRGRDKPKNPVVGEHMLQYSGKRGWVWVPIKK
jgi:hypothetical protein